MTIRPVAGRPALFRAALLAGLAALWAGPSPARDPAPDATGDASVSAVAPDPGADSTADASSDAALEADRREREAEQHRARIAAATAEAMAPGLAVGSIPATMASAEVFRPAPLPDEAARIPEARTASNADDATSLHPDFFHMSEKTSGALPTTSSEYEHTSRVGPAGGMSLSIPMD